MSDIWWEKLQADVLKPKLETADGTCVGVSEGTLAYKELPNGELEVVRTDSKNPVPQIAYDACPGAHCNYVDLNQFVFGKTPSNWLCGVVEQAYVGHAADDAIRRAGASGGVITCVLMHLLETQKITGAVCLNMGAKKPWLATPVVATTKEEILACAQSVYSQTPTNLILPKLIEHEGPLAYVGLPDQVAGIRKLQKLGHPSVKNIKYVLGPYTGTQMTFEAIRSFLRSHGVKSETEIVKLQYRAGEWPGHLQIDLRDGRQLKAAKFHYNYLIPFFITRGCKQLCDFTNELTDISVGDAWNPTLEKQGEGHSVILARSKAGKELLEEMRAANLLSLEKAETQKALDMHGHMIDFKKRGSFIRNSWKRAQPDYGYVPMRIPASRIAVEWVLRMLFGIGQLNISRWTVEHLPLSIVGPMFNVLRKSWKASSKPTKRKGLKEMKFSETTVS